MLHTNATDRSITVWWEKPVQAQATYEVRLGDVPVATVGRTHYTFEGLEPDTRYTIGVKMGGVFSYAEVSTRKEYRRIDVTKAPYCASGDGEQLNTRILQQAIDDCKEDDCLYFPAGIYLTGALRLHSHMAVYLDQDATLQGTANFKDYEPLIASRFEGHERMCYSSLLNMGSLDRNAGPNCEDVLLYGKGAIVGGGRPLAQAIVDDEIPRYRKHLESIGAEIPDSERLRMITGRIRPRLINMSNCSNIRISGLTLADGASWNVHMIYSQNITTDHCTFRSRNVWNGDGWDPDSSEDCTIFACEFFTGDDAIAIKSGKNPEGNLIARPTRRINIFDCASAYGHAFTVGSEMSGGVEDIHIWDCDMSSQTYGLEIKGTAKRGGYVRNVYVRDCTVSRVLVHSVGYNDDGEAAPEPPRFSDFVFENLTILGKYVGHDGLIYDCAAIELEGFDKPGYEIENVAVKNCRVKQGSDIKMSRCKNIHLNMIEIE